jgi:hypothetical protein
MHILGFARDEMTDKTFRELTWKPAKELIDLAVCHDVLGQVCPVAQLRPRKTRWLVAVLFARDPHFLY